jgi:hypothetical protein
MYVSQETPAQTQDRLLRVLSQSKFTVLEGTYTFEEFAHSQLLPRMKMDALALVRDDTHWSQLVPGREIDRRTFQSLPLSLSWGYGQQRICRLARAPSKAN